MKKNNTVKQSLKKSTKKTTKSAQGSITIGMDLGDKASRYCVLNGAGEVTEEGSVPTSQKGMMQMFGALRRCRIAMEVGGNSPWVSRLLIALGHEVIVANARQVKLISASSRKNDRLSVNFRRIRSRAASTRGLPVFGMLLSAILLAYREQVLMTLEIAIRQPPAINIQRMAGYKASLLTQQKRHRIRHIGGLRQTA